MHLVTHVQHRQGLPSQHKRPCSQSWGTLLRSHGSMPPAAQPMGRLPGRLALKRGSASPLPRRTTKTSKRRARPPEARVPKTSRVAGLRKVHVGSDGSGIGAVVLALESIPCLDDVVHEFASEETTLVRQVLIHNFRHIQHVYDDPTVRDIACTRRTDLYFNLSPGPLPQDRGVMPIQLLVFHGTCRGLACL